MTSNGSLTSKSSRGSSSNVKPPRSIDLYAAQCEDCFKWRIINSLVEYEQIRSEMEYTPFVCGRKRGCSCEVPADIDYDSSRVWVLDKPGIPKTPEGFKRSLVLRRDFSKMDAYYITPSGKKLRTRNEVAAFLDAHPEYENVSLSDFTFQVPKVADGTIPETMRKATFDADSRRKFKTSKEISGENWM